MKAIILSAGQGSRLGHLVDDRPKCLIDFNGRTLLDRQLDTLEANGVEEAVVVTGFHDELVNEAIAVLRQCSGRHLPDGGWESCWDELVVHALHEGDRIEPWETVLTIEGDYSLFAHLETVYLGCLARRSLVMRNVAAVVRAAAGKPILFFPARHDHWLVQTGDGWAAHVAGAIGVPDCGARVAGGEARLQQSPEQDGPDFAQAQHGHSLVDHGVLSASIPRAASPRRFSRRGT